MRENSHILYYWRDFYKNIKEEKVGWLGTSISSKVFRDFNDSLSPTYDSWIIAFKWEKDKPYPLAILKAVIERVVKIKPDKDYESFIYYDPWQSFKLAQPTNSSELKKYLALGHKIISLIESGLINEYQTGRIECRLRGLPDVALQVHILARVLGRYQRFF